MPRYVDSQDRQRATLLPECLDDFIGEDNPVRIVDGMVLHTYARYGYSDCPMKAECTPASFRRIQRWEHEDAPTTCSTGWTATPTR